MNYYIISQVLFPVFFIVMSLGYYLSAKLGYYKKDVLSGVIKILTKSFGLKLATFAMYLFDLVVSIALFAVAASEWWYVVILIIELIVHLIVCFKCKIYLNNLNSIKTS